MLQYKFIRYAIIINIATNGEKINITSQSSNVTLELNEAQM